MNCKKHLLINYGQWTGELLSYTMNTNIIVKCQILYPRNVNSENYSLLECDIVQLGRQSPILVAAGATLKFDVADPLQILVPK